MADQEGLARRRETAAGCACVSIAGVALALLAVVLMLPVSRANRDSGQAVMCQSNLRQVGGALLDYCGDWDGTLPQAADWCDGVGQYAASVRVFVCPATDSSSPTDYWLHRPVAGLRTRCVAHPEATFLLFEARNWPNGFGGRGAVTARHQGGAIYCYLDGHSKWRRPEDVPTEAWRVDALEQWQALPVESAESEGSNGVTDGRAPIRLATPR